MPSETVSHLRPSRNTADEITEADGAIATVASEFPHDEAGPVLPMERKKLRDLIDVNVLVPSHLLTLADVNECLSTLTEPPPFYAEDPTSIQQQLGGYFAVMERFFAALRTAGDVDIAAVAALTQIDLAEVAWLELKNCTDPGIRKRLWQEMRDALRQAVDAPPYTPRRSPEPTKYIYDEYKKRSTDAKEDYFDPKEFYRYVARSRRWFLPVDPNKAILVQQQQMPDTAKIDEDLLDGRHAKTWVHPADAERVAGLKTYLARRRARIISLWIASQA